MQGQIDGATTLSQLFIYMNNFLQFELTSYLAKSKNWYIPFYGLEAHLLYIEVYQTT